MTRPLNDLEQEVVDYLEEGYARWKIAEMLGVGDTSVRAIIKRLCTEYNCSMKELPQKIKGEQDADGQQNRDPDGEEHEALNPDTSTRDHQ